MSVTEARDIARGSDAFSVIRGVSYDKSEVSQAPRQGFVPLLRATNVQSGRLVFDELVYVPARYVSPDQYLRSGDLVIATSSGSRSVVGKTAMAAPEHGAYTFGAFCAVARPRQNAVPEWLKYYTQSRAYRRYVEERALGININNLRTTDLERMPIPLPRPEVQRELVTKLDALFTHSASARAELARMPSLAERYRNAVLRSAFSGELTRQWRSERPAERAGSELLAHYIAVRQRFLADKKRKTEEPTARAAAGLPPLPKSWAWVPLQVLASAIVDGVHKKPAYVESGVPFLTVRNLTAGPSIVFENCRYVTEADHREFIKRTHPEEGDLLITKDGTLGVVRAVRTHEVFSIFVSLALVKPLDREMTDYLELALAAPQVQTQMVGVGSGLQHIHLTDLRKDFIPVAPPMERAEIVKRCRALTERIDQPLDETSRAMGLLDRLEEETLRKAFRGELRGSLALERAPK